MNYQIEQVSETEFRYRDWRFYRNLELREGCLGAYTTIGTRFTSIEEVTEYIDQKCDNPRRPRIGGITDVIIPAGHLENHSAYYHYPEV